MIILPLAAGKMRLKLLQERLPGISAGVLDRHLQQMVALGLVTRTRFKEMPPRVELELTDAGRELLPIAAALARWGMLHMWSAPEAREVVGVEALLRLLPALLEGEADLPDLCLEAIVEQEDERYDRVRYRLKDGRLQLDADSDEDPAVSIRGDKGAWIAALGPARDYTTLRFGGDERAARRFLDALPRPE
jgi:DNA-binding HxlR family transcriptional regulator